MIPRRLGPATGVRCMGLMSGCGACGPGTIGVMLIKIGDIEVDIPDEHGEAVASHISRLAKAADEGAAAKARADELAAAQARAQREADEARRQAEIAEAAQKGEIEKVQELANQRVGQLSERYRDSELRSALANQPRLRRDGLDDAARRALIDDQLATLRAGLRFDLEAGVLADAQGKPVDVTAVIDSHISARPWLAEQPGGSSGAGPTGGGGGGSPGEIRIADLARITPQQAQDIESGKLIVVE